MAVRAGASYVVFDTSRVAAVLAQDHYSTIVVDGRELLSDDSLDRLSVRLSEESFMRVHRSAILNIDFVRELQQEGDRKYVAILDNPAKTRVPISRDKLDEVKLRLREFLRGLAASRATRLHRCAASQSVSFHALWIPTTMYVTRPIAMNCIGIAHPTASAIPTQVRVSVAASGWPRCDPHSASDSGCRARWIRSRPSVERTVRTILSAARMHTAYPNDLSVRPGKTPTALTTRMRTKA